MKSFKISVVVPSKNNGKTINLCLRSILKALNIAQRLYPHLQSEVIVVDAHSTDETPRVLEQYLRTHLIKVIYDEGKGLGPARNLALRNVKGDIVFFVDADCIVEPLHFAKFLKIFEKDGRIAIVWTPGTFHKLSRKSFPKIACLSLEFTHVETSSKRVVEDTIYAAGAFLAVRHDVALKVGGFWNTPWAADDIEFSYRVWRAGYRVTKILTYSISLPRMTLRDLWKQQVWYGIGVVCFYMRHRYDLVFWRTRGRSLYMLFKVFGPTLAVTWVVLRALLSSLRALRLWLTKKLSFEAAILLVFKRLANLVGMLKGLREHKRALRQQCI